MQQLPLLGETSPITWAGSLTQEVQDDGSVRPWRLPHEDAALYEGTHNGAAGLFNLAGMAAGTRITFLTTAQSIELTLCHRSCGPNTCIDLCVGNDVSPPFPLAPPPRPASCAPAPG